MLFILQFHVLTEITEYFEFCFYHILTQRARELGNETSFAVEEALFMKH